MNLDAISDGSLCASDILHMILKRGGGGGGWGGGLWEMIIVKGQEGRTLYHGISAMLGHSDKATI